MRRVMRLYLSWPLLELVFVALLPLGLIVESSIANSSAYGFVGFWPLPALGASLVALLRGFFFEVLTYVCTRTAAIMARKGAKEHWFPLAIMAVLSVFLVLVSAVNNLGWVLSGHDLDGMFSLLGRLLPPFIYVPYQIGLAILLPLAVGGIALVDLDHFVHDLLDKDAMDNHAVLIEERIMHRTAFLQSLRSQEPTIRGAYDEITEDRTQSFIERVSAGDMSFGSTTSPLGSETSHVATQPTLLLPSGGPNRVFPVE